MSIHPRNKTLDVENNILFHDVFQLEHIQRLQDIFSETTGVASILLDTDGKPLTTPSNFCRLCNEYLSKLDKSVQYCFKNDGFMHSESPINVGGKHLANWLIGQVRQEKTDEKWIVDIANQAMSEKVQIMEAWKEVPIMFEHQFKKVVNGFSALATEISEKAFTQYLLKEQIAEREKTDKLLKENEDRFQMLFNQAPLGYQSLDSDGRFLEVNEQWLITLGYSREEVLGKWFGDFLSPAYTEGFRKRFPLFKAQGKIHSEFEMVHKDGHPLFIAFDGKIGYDANGDFKQTHCILKDITDQKQSEEKLKASQDKLAIVFKTMEEGIALNEFVRDEHGEIVDYRIIEVNSAFERITLLPREYVLNKVATELYGMTSEYINHFWKQNPEKIRSIKTEFFHEQTKGWYQVSISQPIDDKFVSSFYDITEKKQSEKQIRLLSKATEQSPVTVVITDKDGKISYVNTKFVELTGYSLEEVKDKNPNILQSGLHTKEFYQDFWKTILSGRDWIGEFHNKKKNGELYWESAIVTSLLDSQGEISAFIAVKEDVTEKKKIIKDLIKAKEKAEESDRLKTAFLANVSHEIRTPMNGILGFAELLKDPDLTAHEQKEYIHIIEKSGARMLNIINDIIDISKIESGQIEVNISDINVNELMGFITDFFKPEVEKKGLSFIRSKILPENECIVYSDSAKIYAVLINLVKNALKFTDFGMIDIGCQLKPKDIQQIDGIKTIDPLVMQFFVKDSGMGIPEEQLDLIFERFRQGSEQLNRNYEGAGLGLSISKAFVEMLGGKIWVESELGKGSTFYFTIPYKKVPVGV